MSVQRSPQHGRRRSRAAAAAAVVAKPFLVALAASGGLSVFLGAAIAAPPGAAPSARAATTSRVVVVGARSVPADVLERAARQAASNISDPAAATRAAAAAVVREYRRRGFPVAQVVESAPQPDGSLRLTVAEGVVRRILLRGNRKTRSGTIVAALATRPGDVYREDRAQDDRNRLARLGIFEDVTIAPASPGELEREEAQARQAAGPDASSPATPPAAPPSVAVAASADEDTVGLVDVIVRVRERRTGNIAAALGFGGRSGLIGYADASETNFAGRAQRVSLQFQRFSRTYFDERDGVLREEDARAAYSLSYFAPFLGARSTAIGVDVYDKNTIFQPLFGAEDETLRTYERRRGATLRVGRQPGPRGVSAFVTVRRDQVGYDPIPLRLDPPLGELADADATVGALGLEVAWDTRDALLNPATGFYASLAYENAAGYFGGNRSFDRALLDLRAYLPLFGRPARTSRATGGLRPGEAGSAPSAPPDASNTPASAGASSPAENRSRRGGNPGPVLAARVLGGTASGDVPLPEQFFIGGYDLLRGYDLYSIRGTRLVLASLEGRIPLAAGVQGALFVDAGNAWQPGQRVSLGDLRAGVGAGVRFLSPIGPLRLDIAYGNELKTYISLGQAY